MRNSIFVLGILTMLTACSKRESLTEISGGSSGSEGPSWPQWRGPDRNGMLEASGESLTSIVEDQDLKWKVSLEGKGTSTPVVWDERIYVTTEVAGENGVICLGMDGQEHWRVQLGPIREGKNRQGGSCNPSPLTDGKNLFAYFKSGAVVSLDMDGEVIWKKNLQEMYGEDTLWWDLGTSPVFADGKLVIVVMQAGNSYMISLNKSDGSVAWKTDRNFINNRESDQAYTTPLLLKNEEGIETLVTWGADHLTCHRADNGELLWVCGGFNPLNKPMWRVIASPAENEGIAVVPYGRGGFLAGVRLGGKGDITATNRVWERKGFGADVPTPIAFDGKVILLTDRGALHCLDVESGEDIWTAEIPRAATNYFASPVLVGREILYCAREDGTLFIIRLREDGIEILSEYSLGEGVVATPVPLGNMLLIRGYDHLYCFAN